MRAWHLTLSFAVSLAACAVAHAQIAGDKVKIGVLTDISAVFAEIYLPGRSLTNRASHCAAGLYS
jgi:hypothetical protein